MSLVLDVSIAATWFLRYEHDPIAAAILDRVELEGAHVPALFRWEIESVLINAERDGRISPEDVDAALEALRDLPIAVADPGSRVFAGSEMIFARHYDISPYDAAYLSLAENHRIPLATADASLASAARDLGVDVIS